MRMRKRVGRNHIGFDLGDIWVIMFTVVMGVFLLECCLLLLRQKKSATINETLGSNHLPLLPNLPKRNRECYACSFLFAFVGGSTKE